MAVLGAKTKPGPPPGVGGHAWGETLPHGHPVPLQHPFPVLNQWGLKASGGIGSWGVLGLH